MKSLLSSLPRIAGAGLLVAAAPATITDRIAGPDGSFDYASVDQVTRHLYVARGDAVTVVDLAHGNRVSSIGTIVHGHAVLPLPGTTLLLVTSGKDDSVRLIDMKDGTQTAQIAVGSDPDAAAWLPEQHEAAVMNAKAGSVSFIDVGAAKVNHMVQLKPGLEFGATDGTTLFVNNENANEIETIDLATYVMGKAIALPGCEEPSGLAYDAPSNRLVSACANGKAAVADPSGKTPIKLLAIGKGPDAVILDGARRHAYIPCGKDGTVSVIALDGPGGAHVTGKIQTEVGAKTGALDPIDGSLFLPTAKFTPAASPEGKPQRIAGSFHILHVRTH